MIARVTETRGPLAAQDWGVGIDAGGDLVVQMNGETYLRLGLPAEALIRLRDGAVAALAARSAE